MTKIGGLPGNCGQNLHLTYFHKGEGRGGVLVKMDLQYSTELLTHLRNRKNIREKRKELKDQFYSQKASEINTAAEARQVEKEFYYVQFFLQFYYFAMHKKPSSKIEISKEKLTKHNNYHILAVFFLLFICQWVVDCDRHY